MLDVARGIGEDGGDALVHDDAIAFRARALHQPAGRCIGQGSGGHRGEGDNDVQPAPQQGEDGHDDGRHDGRRAGPIEGTVRDEDRPQQGVWQDQVLPGQDEADVARERCRVYRDERVERQRGNQERQQRRQEARCAPSAWSDRRGAVPCARATAMCIPLRWPTRCSSVTSPASLAAATPGGAVGSRPRRRAAPPRRRSIARCTSIVPASQSPARR